MIDRNAQISTTTRLFESFVSFQNSKSNEVNIMSRTTVNRMKLLFNDVYD
jgi:hypothetical protein